MVQRDALVIDEAASADRCRAFEASCDATVAAETAFLRASSARAVLGDIPPLAFAAATRAGVPGLALGNFSWDWIYRHLAARQPSLVASAERAARAYVKAGLLLELPFAGDLSVFPRRERIELVARRPQIAREEARRRLGLDSRPTVLVSFGGLGLPRLAPETFASHDGLRFLLPREVAAAWLEALGLEYLDLVGAADVVVTKPGYGIVSDAIGAGTRLVYTDRGDFPEYPIMVREMPRYLPCAHVANAELRAGQLEGPIRRVLAQPPAYLASIVFRLSKPEM